MRNEHGKLQQVQSEPNKIGLLRRLDALPSSGIVRPGRGMCGRHCMAVARHWPLYADVGDGRLHRGGGVAGQGHRNHVRGSSSPGGFTGPRGAAWTIRRGTRRIAPRSAIGWLAGHVTVTFRAAARTPMQAPHQAACRQQSWHCRVVTPVAMAREKCRPIFPLARASLMTVARVEDRSLETVVEALT
jgi:hypothetical protein